MAPGKPNNNQQYGSKSQKCENCGTWHPGNECENKIYLDNKNYNCGCDTNSRLAIKGYEMGYDNHCCVCKKGIKFIKSNWIVKETNTKGAIRCWECYQNNQLPQQRRFPKNNQNIEILKDNNGPINDKTTSYADIVRKNDQKQKQPIRNENDFISTIGEYKQPKLPFNCKNCNKKVTSSLNSGENELCRTCDHNLNTSKDVCECYACNEKILRSESVTLEGPNYIPNESPITTYRFCSRDCKALLVIILRIKDDRSNDPYETIIERKIRQYLMKDEILIGNDEEDDEITREWIDKETKFNEKFNNRNFEEPKNVIGQIFTDNQITTIEYQKVGELPIPNEIRNQIAEENIKNYRNMEIDQQLEVTNKITESRDQELTKQWNDTWSNYDQQTNDDQNKTTDQQIKPQELEQMTTELQNMIDQITVPNNDVRPLTLDAADEITKLKNEVTQLKENMRLKNNEIEWYQLEVANRTNDLQQIQQQWTTFHNQEMNRTIESVINERNQYWHNYYHQKTVRAIAIQTEEIDYDNDEQIQKLISENTKIATKVNDQKRESNQLKKELKEQTDKVELQNKHYQQMTQQLQQKNEAATKLMTELTQQVTQLTKENNQLKVNEEEAKQDFENIVQNFSKEFLEIQKENEKLREKIKKYEEPIENFINDEESVQNIDMDYFEYLQQKSNQPEPATIQTNIFDQNCKKCKRSFKTLEEDNQYCNNCIKRPRTISKIPRKLKTFFRK